MESYDYEKQEYARRLYVVDGLTFRRISDLTGVSESTLKRWANGDAADRADPQFVPWGEQKRFFRRNETNIELKFAELRLRLLEEALKTIDPKLLYPMARLTEAVAKSDAMWRTETRMDDIPESGGKIGSLSDAEPALEEAIAKKVSVMTLGGGKMSLEKLKELSESLNILEKLKAVITDDSPKPTDNSGDKNNVLLERVNEILGA